MDDGSIWVSTDTEGIVRYNEGAGSGDQRGERIAFEGNDLSLPGQRSGGRLWVGSAEGVVYSLDENPEPQSSIKPMLISASIDGKKNSLEEIQLFLDQQLH